jgi:hypothetical protein
MSEQGGYGFRAGRVANPWSLSRVAEKAAPVERRLLCLLLLPADLESFPLRAHVEDLLTGPAVLGVEPPRLGRSAGVPPSLADGLATGAARRMKLPGFPRVLVIFHPLQYPLARGLFMAYPDAELWYWRHAPLSLTGSRRRRGRVEELHLAASFRAALIVVASEAERAVAQEEGHDPLLLEPTDDPHADNRPLWERIEARGIESGRLGSERIL